MKTKQLTALLISATCLVSLSSVNVFADDYSLGDINNDSVINASDSSDILNDYANFSSGKGHIFNESQLLVADVNNDGEVNASDSSSVLSYYAYTSSGGEKDLKSFLETGANDDVPEIKIDPNIIGVWCLKDPPQSSSTYKVPVAYKYTDSGEVIRMFALNIGIDENNLIISSEGQYPYTFDGNAFLSQYSDQTILEMQKCDGKNELSGKYLITSGLVYDIANNSALTVENNPIYAIIDGNDVYFETKTIDFSTQNGNFITSDDIAGYTVSENVLMFSYTDGTTSYRYRIKDNAKNLKNCYQIANVTLEIYKTDKNIEMYSKFVQSENESIKEYTQCLEETSKEIESCNIKLENAKRNKVRVYSSQGGWIWKENTEAIKKAQDDVDFYTDIFNSYKNLIEVCSESLNEYQSKLDENIAKKSTLTDQLNFLKN